MRVNIYPSGDVAEFGAVRWNVEWWTARPGAEDSEDGVGPDNVDSHYRSFTTEAAATKYAARIAAKSAFNYALVQKQVVDWCSEADRVGEWSDVGTSVDVYP